MRPKQKQIIERKSSTKKHLNYRLPFFRQNSQNSRDFSNLTSEMISPPHARPLKPTLSIRTLKTNRLSSTALNHTYAHDCESTRQSEKIPKLSSSTGYFHVTLQFSSEEVHLKSQAHNIEALTHEIKKIMTKKQSKYLPFVLASSEGNLQLNYYLTLPHSSTHCFEGKTISLKPYFLSQEITVDIKSFEIIKNIGAGGFSKVYLVRFKGDGLFYAMKVISKAFIIKNKKQQLIMNEKNIMKEINHPLHAKLHWSFESKQSLILVMDFYPGGELFGLIRRFKKMSQKMAKFYIIQVLLALEKLHSSGVAYRDMKPENILLDRQGHAHLADFGLVKPGLHDGSKTYSFCGSPEYMPPEVIGRKGHSLEADFYSLGALLYELITGLPPFYSRDPEKIYKATLRQQLVLFSTFSVNLRSLLEGLLCKQHETRLGSRYGVSEILQHPWFGRVKKSQYVQKTIEAPIRFDRLEDLKFEEQDKKGDQFVYSLKEEQRDCQDYKKMFSNFDCTLRPAGLVLPESSYGPSTKRVSCRKPFLKQRKRTEQSYCSPRSRPSKVNNFF